MKTTIKSIRACVAAWRNLLQHLRIIKADKPLDIAAILDRHSPTYSRENVTSLGKVHARDLRLYAVKHARKVQHMMKDPRSVRAVDVAEKYANGDATDAELRDACENAVDAAIATDPAGSHSARCAAFATTLDNAGAAAIDALHFAQFALAYAEQADAAQ